MTVAARRRMQPTVGPSATAAEPPFRDEYWRKLLHRWLVQYNPVYLVSAALVLVGLNMSSRGLAGRGNLHAELGVAALAESYAASLILGCALLVRRGSPRPAVMLALLAVLYQSDLTLQTETNAYLGGVGVFASTVWVACFAAKLAGLSWALRLELSRSAWSLLMVGAVGLAVLPQWSGALPERMLSAAIAAWWFGLMSVGLHSRRAVLCHLVLDDWGRTVLRRSLRASWLILSVLLAAHVAFWCIHFEASAAPLLPAGVLLGLRWVKREIRVWLVLAGTLLLTAWLLPESLSATALLVPIALGVRACRRPEPPAAFEFERRLGAPYRAPNGQPDRFRGLDPQRAAMTPARRDERVRYLLGGLASLHLAAWAAGWTGGSWPDHVWQVDAMLAAGALVCVWRLRLRAALVLPSLVYAHLLAPRVPTPATTLEWGATYLAVGFGLLLAGLGTHQALQRWLSPGVNTRSRSTSACHPS